RYPPELIKKYLATYAKTVNMSMYDLLALGRQNPEDEHEQFNMAYLALRGSVAANGVSRLHGQVSREMFQPFFHRWPREEVPIGYVTNGVHVPSWDSREADQLWEKTCGKDRWMGLARTTATENMRGVSDAELWQLRSNARAKLIHFSRRRLARELAASGASAAEVDEASRILDHKVLTHGFARRFATYKRPTLLLHDPERLVRLLTNPHQPVQLLIAGKAHPADEPGQALIRQWIDFIRRRPEVHQHAVFLPDYDMLLTEQLVQGVDVWINNPRRPWEACGTSGMKVLVNGGLNLSELDGWWAEAYEPGVGWAIQKEHVDDPQSDAAEAEALYSKLEEEIIPLFYHRDSRGFPVGWLSHVRESMARLTPQYSADRAVREYTEKYYLLAASLYHERSQQDGARAARLLSWQRALAERWPSLHLGEMKVETNDGQHDFRVYIHLGELSPDSVNVEVYADALPGGQLERHTMSVDSAAETSSAGSYLYSVRFPATRSVSDYTARVVTQNPEAIIPLEA